MAISCVRCGAIAEDFFCDSCIYDIEDKYAKLMKENFTERELSIILCCITNPYMENPYWDMAINRYKKSMNEKYLMSIIDKYIKLMKDNFREDEYDCTNENMIRWEV